MSQLIQASNPIAFTSAIPFNTLITSMATTITGAITFTKNTTGAVAGFGTILRLTGNGTHTPDFSAFKKTTASQEFDNTVGKVNLITFFFDGIDYWCSIQQESAWGTVPPDEEVPPALQVAGVNPINVFSSGTIVPDKYINSTGVESVAAGWKLVKIPITGQPKIWLKGFGGRPSGVPSAFYRFWDGTIMSYGGFNDFEVLELTIPSGATSLDFTLKQSGESDDVFINGFVSFTAFDSVLYSGNELTELPTSQITTEVCNHKYGAACAVVQCSDTLNTNSWTAAEFFAFKRNVQLTAFVNPYDGGQSPFSIIQDVGRIKFGLYMPTDRWKNPSTGVVELIPDYTALNWTSAGVAAFGVTLGASKVDRFPNHGQEMFDLTSGAIGWNMTTGTPGANGGDEYYGMLDTISDLLDINLGKKLTTFSYRNGQLGCATLALSRFLGGRNSDYPLTLSEDSKTDFGQNNDIYLGLPQQVTSRLDKISAKPSTRNYDMWFSYGVGTQTQVLDYVEAEILKTIANGGFFTDFVHWHSLSSNLNYLDTFFQLLNETIGSNFVWRSSYEESLQYLFFREMVESVSSYEVDEKVAIVIKKTDPYKSISTSGISQQIDYELLKTSELSIAINLTGTVLAGKDIESSVGSVRHVSGNQFVIQIPFGAVDEGFTGVELSETLTPDYLNFTVPLITSTTKVGNVITVTTDLPTRSTLFRSSAGGAESTVVIHSRRTNLSTSHVYDISTHPTLDFRIGVITEQGQSAVSGVITA